MKRKRRRKQHNPKIIIAGLALMFAFITEMLFYAWCRTQYVNVKYQIQEQTIRKRKLEEMQDHLKIELGRLKSPRRIVKIAREQLDMVMPTPQQTIILPDEK
jgi:cell division protein FtsL